MDEKENSEKLPTNEEETISLISSLPSDIDIHGNMLYKYQGCWYNSTTVQAVINFQRGFEPQETDKIVASFPKSGTTWLKALTVAVLKRSKHSSGNHPLLSYNPHGLVPIVEQRLFIETSKPDLTEFSAPPRLFSTHVPLNTLREGLKNSPCKVVYIWRNVKDTLVSLWYFECANLKMENEEDRRSMLEPTFESFCRGVGYYGPFWEHVLSYRRGSLEDPKHVLFLRYEELKAEPRLQLKKLAEFLDCPFTTEEEESGALEEILELCSFRNLKNLEINKIGKTSRGLDHKNFFRKGEVGDSKNYLTPEMENRIDMIIKEKFRDSDLIF